MRDHTPCVDELAFRLRTNASTAYNVALRCNGEIFFPMGGTVRSGRRSEIGNGRRASEWNRIGGAMTGTGCSRQGSVSLNAT
jgi:hypothetical protein